MFHSLTISSEGDVYSFGTNSHGQLGITSNIKSKKMPQKIEKLNNIIQTSCGNLHSLALTKDGDIYSFGFNNYGQLGLGSYRDKEYKPTLIENLKNVVQVSCSHSNHSLALTKDGEVFSFGRNQCGQLGLGIDEEACWVPTKIENLKGVVQVSCGVDFSLVLTDEGSVFFFWE